MQTKLLHLVGCILCVIWFNSCGILHHHTVATYTKSVSKAPFDVVIVPGLPYDTSKINPLLKARMLWAKELYENGIARHIIFSGSAVHSPYIEALIMKMMADSMGIPTRHTFIEDKALHSHENLSFGVSLARKMGFKSIALATDPIQAFFLQKFTKANHDQVHILPFGMRRMPEFYSARIPVVNAENAFVEDFVPLKLRPSDPVIIRD